jgi:hypothetical protein
MLVAYAPAIHQAIASGDLAQMKAMVTHAENSLKETGDVAAALEVLKNEIAKLERKPKP